MYDVLLFIGNCYGIYRATQDAGGQFLSEDQEARQSYMEAWLITKNAL